MRLLHPFRVMHAAVREALKRRLRSPRWRVLEQRWLEYHGACAACGSVKRLQVHHIIPVHEQPRLELEPSNLITLCMGLPECHLRVGHLGRWSDSNPDVVADARRSLSRRLSP